MSLPSTDTAGAGDLAGKRLLVGIAGGIAVYKVATVVSRLAQAGAEVTVCMTEAATRFVAPLTFQALSANPVYTSPWQHVESSDPQHISLARRADLAVVAPCTMHTMAKLALGLTDDMVTLMLSAIDAREKPVLLAPAMNEVMWGQASTRRNRDTLEADGFRFVGPGVGWQACRAVGAGRMSEPEEIVAEVRRLLGVEAAV